MNIVERLKQYQKGTFDVSIEEALHLFYKMKLKIPAYKEYEPYNATYANLMYNCNAIAQVDETIYVLKVGKNDFTLLILPIFLTDSMFSEKSESILKDLVRAKILSDYPLSYLENKFNVKNWNFFNSFIYEWKDLEHYFEPNGGCSYKRRKIFNELAKIYPCYTVEIKDLNLTHIKHIEQVNREWFEHMKEEHSDYGYGLQKLTKVLKDASNREIISRNTKAFLNFYYKDGEPVAYSYCEVHGGTSIIYESKSLIKPQSSFRYITYHCCRVAAERGAVINNIGWAREEANIGQADHKILTTGPNLTDTKATLPHRISYCLSFFPKAGGVEEKKSRDLF